jgi:hypothetical protein
VCFKRARPSSTRCGVCGLAAEGTECDQEQGDKERRWGCARVSARVGCGLRREGKCGGGQSAWRGDRPPGVRRCVDAQGVRERSQREEDKDSRVFLCDQA